MKTRSTELEGVLPDPPKAIIVDEEPYTGVPTELVGVQTDTGHEQGNSAVSPIKGGGLGVLLLVILYILKRFYFRG